MTATPLSDHITKLGTCKVCAPCSHHFEHCLTNENCCHDEGLKCVKLCAPPYLRPAAPRARLVLTCAPARPRSHHGFYLSTGVCLKEECVGDHLSGPCHDELELLHWLQCGVNWGDCSWDWSAWAAPTSRAAAAAGSCVQANGIAAGAALPANCFGDAAAAKMGVRGMAPAGAVALVATSDALAGFAPSTVGDTGLRVDFAVAAGAFGAWFSLAPPGGAPATGRAAGRSTLEAAARGAAPVNAAARGFASARGTGVATAKAAAGAAGITVTGLSATGAVTFSTTAECAADAVECFIGWAAPDAATSTLMAFTIAAPTGSAVVPALRSVTFYPAAKPASSAGDMCGIDLMGSWHSN